LLDLPLLLFLLLPLPLPLFRFFLSGPSAHATRSRREPNRRSRTWATAVLARPLLALFGVTSLHDDKAAKQREPKPKDSTAIRKNRS
jgi:hypothetical protein